MMDTKDRDDESNFLIAEYDPYKLPDEIVPVPMIQKAILYCRYGTPLRCALKLLFYTGCRIVELDNMYWEHKTSQFIRWKCGKNQRGWREEYLPLDFWHELEHHRMNNKCYNGRLLSASGESMVRLFNRDIRPYLGIEWNERSHFVDERRLVKREYKYQLKSLRKIFQTLLLQHYWDYYKCVDVAGEHVSKRMRHSSAGINWKHYFRMAKELHAERYVNMMPFKILNSIDQKRIFDYC